MSSDIDKVLEWADDEYKRRTKAIKSGESTNVDWLEPTTRVSATEIMSQADAMGLKVDRFELQEALAKRSPRKYTAKW